MELIRHPATPCDAVSRVAVDVARPSEGTLLLIYRATGVIAGLRLPAAAAPVRTDELWKHTCFEAFVADGSGYLEFNFAPSTQWAAYRFDGYREGMRNAELAAAPAVEIRRDVGRLELHAALSLPEPPIRLGLSSVIEEISGRKSYWALAHPAGRPDFHHRDCFAFELPPASAT